jgi:nicotinamidase/pyrazinamidase
MHPLVFVDVDTQFDFMDPSGALYVPRAEGLVPNLTRLFDYAARNEVAVISTTDWHAPDDPEFVRFPPHCVRGTPGQAKLKCTLLPRRTVVGLEPVAGAHDPSRKRQRPPSDAASSEKPVVRHSESSTRASGSDLNDLSELLTTYQQVIFLKQDIDVFTNPNLGRLVDFLCDRGRDAHATRFVVFGVATDYCVRTAALGLLARGGQVEIVEDAVRGLDAEKTRWALRELTDRGAHWTTTADVVGDRSSRDNRLRLSVYDGD